jgi:tetraacyldisaccharide 4'-kinase
MFMFLKKPKFWDETQITFVSILLFPFTIPLIVNNFLLKLFLKPKPKNIFTICVGNIYIGGTGKTPLTIKLYQIIKSINNKVVTAKKFSKNHLDEIKLLEKKSNLLTDNSRMKIIRAAINKKIKTIIFDDGLQDRSINYNLKIVCFDINKWIGNGQLLPSGPLREKISSLKKYDCVFLKNSKNKNKIYYEKIKKINNKIKIFNTKYKIVNLNEFNLKKKYVIFSGIANSKDFLDILQMSKFNIIKSFDFPDHYKYKSSQIRKIIDYAKFKKAVVITTEKDFVKISKIFINKIKCIKIDVFIDESKRLKNFLKKKLNEKI